MHDLDWGVDYVSVSSISLFLSQLLNWHLALDFLVSAALTQFFFPWEYEGGREQQCVGLLKLAFDLVTVSVCLCVFARFHLYFLSSLLISSQLVSVSGVSECDRDRNKWTRCLFEI